MILGREQFMPSQWARQEWQQDQETNLIYVAVTRAQETLVEIVNVPE
jgi:ATP-dependent exoDNAse (exonuclease V) beta subunit